MHRRVKICMVLGRVTRRQYERKRAYGVGLCQKMAQLFLPCFCLVCACFCAVLRCSKCRFIVSYIGNNNILFVTILCPVWAWFLSPLAIVAGSVLGGVGAWAVGWLRVPSVVAPWPVVVGVLRACGLCRL